MMKKTGGSKISLDCPFNKFDWRVIISVVLQLNCVVIKYKYDHFWKLYLNSSSYKMLLEKAKYFVCENNLSSEVVLQRLFKFYLILTRYFVSSFSNFFSRTTLYTRKTIVHICQFNMKVLKYFFFMCSWVGKYRGCL